MATPWLDILARIESVLEWSPGVAPERIVAAEQELGVSVPLQLASFLAVADGICSVDAQCWYGWPLDEIVEMNLRAWSHEPPRLSRSMLSFGGDGAGGWFCLALGTPADERVWWSDPLEDEPREVARDLATFWPAWLDGHLSV
jgi:hypothetical protein